MITSSVELAQIPFEIVQLKVTESSITRPVTPELGANGEVITAVPEITDHVPVPTDGILPPRVVVVKLQIS